MQNTTLDRTIPTLNQDKSSVEYIDARENPTALKDLPPEEVINESLITQKQYRMHVATVFGFEARVIVTNPKDIKDPRSTWWCLADTGNAIGSSKSGSLLGLLHRRERDSRIFTNDEIIFDDFGRKDTLPLNNRGQTFVSLSGFLEILSKTELSSDKIDDFQEEIFGRALPQLAFEGKAEVSDEYKEKIGMPQTQAQPTIFDYARALIAEKERSDALEAQNKALQAEHDETKALLAEEKEKNETLERTKSWIGDKKVASAMGTAGAKSRECERLKKEVCELKSEMELQIYNACKAVRKECEESWMTARDWCYNHGLPVSTNEPKWTVSARLYNICMSYPDRKPQWRRNDYGVRLFPKWACDILDKVYEDDSTFLSEYRIV